MSTELEKYLKEQRPQLDVESPDDSLIWEGIRNGIKEKPRTKRPRGRVLFIRVRNIAAVFLIALLAGYVLHDIIGGDRLNGRLTLASIDKGLAEKERDYQELISYKKDEIGSFDEIDNIIITELIEELNRLDTIYNTVLEDLNNNGYNEKIVNTIFDTYEKKIRILELIILETNKTLKDGNEEYIAL